MDWQESDGAYWQRQAQDARTELESLRKDAERYRWLRESRSIYLGPVVGKRRETKGRRYILSSMSMGSAPEDTDTLDAAIDAAMKAKP